MTAIATRPAARASKRRRSSDPRERAFTALTMAALALLIAALVGIVATLLVRGVPGLGSRVFDPKGDIVRATFGTAITTIVTTFIVMPIGVAAAIHLSEYARQGSVLVKVIRTALRTLASVPSIVFGLFGLGCFVLFLGRGIDSAFYGSEHVFGRPCVLWASMTLAILTLPVVIVTTEEALRAVPRELREAGQALGASKAQTIFRVVVPAARSGILTGAILAVSRGAGEVAAILFTGVATYVPRVPTDLRDAFQHIGYHVYVLATQAAQVDGSDDSAMFACALLFVVATFALNVTAFVLRDRARAHP